MTRHSRTDDDAIAVMVPRNAKPLAPVDGDRVRRLRGSLVKALREARALKAAATPSPPSPAGFKAMVAGVACRLCEGWCCRNGGDDAYLDGETMGRVRRDKPDLDAGALLRLYVNLVPSVAYEGSCIFHGGRGCTLDRSLRADICNSYFCGGLAAYFREEDNDSPRVVLAGEGAAMRSFVVLHPRDLAADGILYETQGGNEHDQTLSRPRVARPGKRLGFPKTQHHAEGGA